VLYHPPASTALDKYHLCITFEDDSFLTATTQMWGAMELYEKGQEQERQYVKGMRTTPAEPEFTFEYFSALIDSLLEGEKRSAKGLLTQDQLVPVWAMRLLRIFFSGRVSTPNIRWAI
jgi:hypothetical protein